MPAGQHDASASAIGYLYQVNWCLVELLQRAPDRPDQAISLETHDDVAWEESGSPTELLQTKHHVGAAMGLGDKHADIWKTLLVWMNTAQPTDPQGPALILVTTSVAPAGTAAHALRRDTRNTQAAVIKLADAARTSISESTEKARKRFLALTEAEQQTLLGRVTVVDGALGIDDLDQKLAKILWAAMPHANQELFLAMVWRWWSGVALDMLRGRRQMVGAGEAQAAISHLRDQFSDDNLPTTVELSDVDENHIIAMHGEDVFVHQMRWVACNEVNLRKAIVDYYRAVTQATKWITEDLIGLHELEKFEDNLRDEWDRAFADMIEDLSLDADEDAKIAAGKALLRRLRDSTAVNVRPRYNDAFFARGRRHVLADHRDIGWHPDFQSRLEELLSVPAALPGAPEGP
ncbi:ABC-three component system protein [Sphaerisporangium sp. NPDC051017]|uniref:ABC-three component system protein n=1 Tax=Sphaerisporangium sp. NPDC051017 TaxID=3154636 RepID=UPI00343711A7